MTDYINIKNRVIKSSMIMAGSQILGKIIIFIGLIGLARLLKPYDFGMALLIQTFVSFFSLFKMEVFNSALVYDRSETDSIYNAGFSGDFLFSFLLFGIMCSLASLWSRFYKQEALIGAARLFGLIMLIESFAVVPKVKLIKKLAFGLLGMAGLLVTFIQTCATIAFAMNGFSFWSIIYGSLIAAVVSVLLLNLLEPSRPQMHFDMNILKRLVGYGKYILIINVAGFLLYAISGVAIGKILSVASAGYYNIAYRWGFWPFNNIFTSLEGILFPIYSKYRADSEAMRGLFLKTLRYSSVLMLPIFLVLFFLAPEFTNIILGERWSPIVIPLRIFCIAGFVQFLGYLSNPLLKGQGYVNIESRRVCLHIALLLLFLFPLIYTMQIIGASLAMLFATIITQLAFYVYSTNVLKIDKREPVRNLYEPIVAAFVMGLAILLTKRFISVFPMSMIWRFIILIASGSLAYALAIIKLMKQEIAFEARYIWTLYKRGAAA